MTVVVMQLIGMALLLKLFEALMKMLKIGGPFDVFARLGMFDGEQVYVVPLNHGYELGEEEKIILT